MGLVWAVGIGLLVLLLSHVPWDAAQAALRAPSVGTWSLTLAGLVLSYGLRAARLQVVLDLPANAAVRRLLGLRLDALRVILMHNAAINLLPMRAGELSFPWLASRLLHLPLARSTASLLWMRLQDLVVLLALAALFWPGLGWGLRGLGLGLLALGWWGGLRLLDHLHKGRQTASATGWRQALSRLHAALVEPSHHRPAAWVFTAANWGVKLAAGACLMSAVVGAPFNAAALGALAGELAAVVPIQGPAGFGTYEAGVWGGFALALGPQHPQLALAIPAALALHLCFVLCAVVAGALAGLLRPGNDPHSAPRIPD